MLKLVTIALISIFMTMSYFNVSAFAAQASSQPQSVTVYGYTYTYASHVVNDSIETWGYGSVMLSSANAPTGYFGINARLYNSSGTIVKSSGMTYNDKPLGGRYVNTGFTSKKGTYYVQSLMSFYNGNGYSTYTCNASPRIQRSLVPMAPEKAYEVNENGLTYGSDFYAESLEDSPDLVRVIGKNGVEGYVYSKDINLELNTLDDVLDYINSGQPEFTVPVYAEDGIEILDNFEIITED